MTRSSIARARGHASLPLLAALLAVAPGPLLAQERQVGLRGGAALATVANETGAGTTTFDLQSGLVAGGFLVWPLGGVALQPEVVYTAKGARLTGDATRVRLLLDYIEVPLLVRWPAGRARRLYVAGGPAFALRVRARTRASFSGATEEIDIARDVERYDLGAVAAGGLQMGSFLVDGRYTYGVRDIDRDRTDGVRVRNRTITITAGVAF